MIFAIISGFCGGFIIGALTIKTLFNETPIYYHNDSNKMIDTAVIKERKNILNKIKKFDIKLGMWGQSVNNPLMKLEDVKSFLLEELNKEEMPVVRKLKVKSIK